MPQNCGMTPFFGGELGIRTLGPVRDTAFRVLHHRPLGQLSIFIFSGTGLQDPRTNARFRCKNSDFQAGYKTPQSPPQRDLPRTNRPVGHALSSAPSYDLLSTSPYSIFQHRLANLSEKCKISMQDKQIKTGTIPRENPRRHAIRGGRIGQWAAKLSSATSSTS